jgi:hypothetical protein
VTNTQKAFRLIGTVWALSIVPAPIHAQGPSVFATGFHNPAPTAESKTRDFHDQQTVFFLMDCTSNAGFTSSFPAT